MSKICETEWYKDGKLSKRITFCTNATREYLVMVVHASIDPKSLKEILEVGFNKSYKDREDAKSIFNGLVVKAAYEEANVVVDFPTEKEVKKVLPLRSSLQIGA